MAGKLEGPCGSRQGVAHEPKGGRESPMYWWCNGPVDGESKWPCGCRQGVAHEQQGGCESPNR